MSAVKYIEGKYSWLQIKRLFYLAPLQEIFLCLPTNPLVLWIRKYSFKKRVLKKPAQFATRGKKIIITGIKDDLRELNKWHKLYFFFIGPGKFSHRLL